MGFSNLPQDCISSILSLTTPQEACQFSSVSSLFQSASDSDLVWQNFLPPNHSEIVANSVSTLEFQTKKQLFLRLCDSVLIDGGLKSFKLDRFSGKKSYILSARDLSITWSDEAMYWIWTSFPGSRFSEVAVLRTMSWLEIEGKIRTKMLSPNTTYGAYLVLKITDRAYGLDLIPSEISIQVGNDQVHTGTAYIRDGSKHDSMKQQMERLLYGNRTQMLKSRVTVEGDGRVASKRGDGWLEIEVGEFFSGENDEMVKMKLMEVKGHHLKGGLVIEGIEVRPKYHKSN